MTSRTLIRLGIALITMSSIASVRGAVEAQKRIEYWRTIPSVKEFTKTRGFFPTLLAIVAGFPDPKPELLRPFAVTQDSAGRVLVADPGQKGVHLYDLEKHKYQFLKGPRGNLMVSPMDVACDSNDDIYVSDSVRARVFVFDSKGKYLRSIGGSATGALQRPTGMALDRKGRRLYLADTLRNQIVVYRMDGSFLRTIGTRGNAEGQFNFPTSLALSAGLLHVVDALNFRVQTFTTEGEFVHAFGTPGNTTGSFNRPKGIAADPEGNLYIVEALFETVQIFNPAGHLLYYFGAGGTRPGQFQLPSGISIDSRNVIYVADSLNRRVEVFHVARNSK